MTPQEVREAAKAGVMDAFESSIVDAKTHNAHHTKLGMLFSVLDKAATTVTRVVVLGFLFLLVYVFGIKKLW